MKLRNKITGEVRDFIISGNIIRTSRGVDYLGYKSIAKLNEEWEDYEEPDKKQFVVSDDGEICPYMVDYINEGTDRGRISIGNYFETEEEAEKAVEKLKAWKRLKDKGFEFTGIYTKNEISFEMDNNNLSFTEANIAEADLALLFGGEE